MARHLRRQGYCVGRKRIRRLMDKMGLVPIFQKPHTSKPCPEHRIYPYLLRDLVDRSAQPGVVCRCHLHPDETRLSLSRRGDGLGEPQGPELAIVEHHGREFCMAALEDAIARFGRPDIFNLGVGEQLLLRRTVDHTCRTVAALCFLCDGLKIGVNHLRDKFVEDRLVPPAEL